jgi:lipoprotein Spr
VEKKTDEIILEEEPKGVERGKIDQKKMGRIIESFFGVRYQLGGETKAGMDCSGLVVAVYKQYAGFALPHDTQKLYKLVKNVDKGDLAYGDLVFFSNGWLSASHVGIYIGEQKFVHSTEDFGVIVSPLNEDYYKKRYMGAKRVIP